MTTGSRLRGYRVERGGDLVGMFEAPSAGAAIRRAAELRGYRPADLTAVAVPAASIEPARSNTRSRGCVHDGVLSMLAGGRRARVADVAERYGPAGRQALRDLHAAGRVALFPLDNRRDITERDRRHAIVIAGDPHHVAYAR